jgi:hypothetical protein
MNNNHPAPPPLLVDAVTKIEINVGGNVLTSLADPRAIGDELGILRHGIVGGLLGLGMQNEQIKNTIMQLHQQVIQRLNDIEDVLVALDVEGILVDGHDNSAVHMILLRMEQAAFKRKVEEAAAGASAGAGGNGVPGVGGTST